MKIIKIKLDGFKNIFETEIEFKNITALLSLNNYGKSNLIEGIDFALAFIYAPKNIKANFMKMISNIPINKFTAEKDFLFEIELLTNVVNKNFYVNYMYKFEWLKTDNKGAFIKQEHLRIKENESDKYSTLMIRKSKSSGLYKSSESGRVDKEIKTDKNELIINKLIHFDSLFYVEIIKELNNFKFDSLNFFDSNEYFEFVPFELISKEKYEFNKFGSNISQIVYDLQNEYNDMYQLLIDSFKQLFPSITDIQPKSIEIKPDINDKIPIDAPFKLKNIKYDIFVFDKFINQPINFSSLSTGTKRIFLFLTEVLLSSIKNIPLVSFEELENNLHPSLFKDILQLFSSIAMDCRILITSHSPYLVKYLNFDNIYIGVPSEKGYAQFKKVKKAKQKSIMKLATQQGTSIGDYLFDTLRESCESTELVEELF